MGIEFFFNNANIIISVIVLGGGTLILIKIVGINNDKKSKKLIQLYLELKFLHKNINYLGNNFFLPKSLIELMELIKEYYNLEEIIIFDSVMMQFKTSRPKILKKEVHDFMQKNLKSISEELKTKEYSTSKIQLNDKKYILYIFKLISGEIDSFIVCVEDHPNLLSKHELLGLSANVALLKLMLLNEQ